MLLQEISFRRGRSNVKVMCHESSIMMEEEKDELENEVGDR